MGWILIVPTTATGGKGLTLCLYRLDARISSFSWRAQFGGLAGNGAIGRYDHEKAYNLAEVEVPYYAAGGQSILAHNTGRRWWRTLRRLLGFGKQTALAPRSLTPEQVQAVESTRQVCGGDCEHAAEILRHILPGGTKRRFAGDRLLHEVYEHQGMAYDVTAQQYVRPDIWTPEELVQAGLNEAVESGVFTLEQHKTFMAKIIRLLGGVED